MKSTLKLCLALVAMFYAVPILVLTGQNTSRSATEAPAGFDNQTNGHLSGKMFDDFRETFEEEEEVEEGLGPVFNDIGCANCHSVPVTGGSSDIVVTRAGTFRRGQFTEHAGGSLVQDKAIHPDILEKLLPQEDHTFRISLSVLGDGFIEAIADETIINIANSQPADVRGMVIQVPVLEANNALRVARFGWKNQHASLESFAADAYLNEMGITSPLAPIENTSDGKSVAAYDQVPDPEDDGDDIRQFADFMRATKAPPRGSISAADDQAGLAIFNAIGCGTCHVATVVTAPTGTAINGGAFRVPPALGSKTIHPFSDFLLHDVGTHDPIVQNGGTDTYNKVRTPPLWGLRIRTRLMHDGQSTSIEDAVRRHGGQAAKSVTALKSLSSTDLQKLMTFLSSL